MNKSIQYIVGWSGETAERKLYLPDEEISVPLVGKILRFIAFMMEEANERIELAFFESAEFTFPDLSRPEMVI